MNFWFVLGFESFLGEKGSLFFVCCGAFWGGRFILSESGFCLIFVFCDFFFCFFLFFVFGLFFFVRFWDFLWGDYFFVIFVLLLFFGLGGFLGCLFCFGLFWGVSRFVTLF